VGRSEAAHAGRRSGSAATGLRGVVTPQVQSAPECTLEVEGRGGKLRIQLRGASASYLATLSRELVESAS
jgi:hypothetical protein